MAISKKERSALWVYWTHDAMLRYEEPDKASDSLEVVKDMEYMSTKYADRMLKAHEKRFGDPLDSEDDEDEDDEDDEDDDEA